MVLYLSCISFASFSIRSLSRSANNLHVWTYTACLYWNVNIKCQLVASLVCIMKVSWNHSFFQSESLKLRGYPGTCILFVWFYTICFLHWQGHIRNVSPANQCSWVHQYHTLYSTSNILSSSHESAVRDNGTRHTKLCLVSISTEKVCHTLWDSNPWR